MSRHTEVKALRRAPTRWRLLAAYAQWLRRHAGMVVGCSIALASACALLAISRLTLDANTDSLIGSNRPFMVGYRAFIEEFGDLEYLYVAIDSRGNANAARRAVDELAPKLRSIPGVREVHASISEAEQWRLAPWTMRANELDGLLAAAPAFPALVSSGTASAAPTSGAVARGADELLARLLGKGASLAEPERRSLGTAALFAIDALTGDPADATWHWARRPTEYLVTESGRMFLIEVMPEKDFSKFETIEGTLRAMRMVIADVAEHHPTVEIGLTGKPVLQADELATSNDDMTRGALIATALISLLTIWVLRSVAPAVLATLTLGVAFACTYGAATLLVGRLNLLSLVFMLVLVSAGIDYGIHLIARYREYRGRFAPESALLRAVRSNTIPIWTGALTSAVVFLAALATDFAGLEELGVIAGVGLVISAAAMTSTLPAGILLHDRWRTRRATRDSRDSRHPPAERAERAALEVTPAPTCEPRSQRTIIVATLAALAAAACIPSLVFESNLLRLQATGLASVEWEERLLEDAESASWFGVAIAGNESELLAIIERAKAEPTIERVRSLFDVVPPDTSECAARRTELGRAIRELGSSSRTTEDLTPTLAHQLADRLEKLQFLAGLRATEAERAELAQIASRVKGLCDALDDPERSAERSARADAAVAQVSSALAAIGEGASGTIRDALPTAIADRLVAPSGRLLASLVPSEDIWEFEPLSRFVAATRRVSHDATGVPITVYESVIDMRHAFICMSTLSLVAIALIVYADFRSVGATAACILTLLVALAWTLGAMAMMGISLNLANFFGVPMLLGFGIDASVHLMHRARETESARALGWTSRAVLVSAATTAIGFGTLLFASHQGLRSLGWLMVIGTVATIAASVYLLPSLLHQFPRLMGRDHRPRARA